MNLAYVFRIGVLRFILNVQESAIGFIYPRIFIGFPDGSYLNYDVALGRFFTMFESDWLSWFDGTEIPLDTAEEIRKVAAEVGINWDIFEEEIFRLYEENKD